MNSGAAFVTFFLITQTLLVLAILLGGMYVLWCLSRLSSSMERLADVAELWLEKEGRATVSATHSVAPTPITPHQSSHESPPVTPVEVVTVAPTTVPTTVVPNSEARS